MSAEAESRPLQPAVRAYTPGRSKPKRPERRDWRPARLLVFDTETEPTAAQSLRFLSYRLLRVAWEEGPPRLACLEEGFVFGDGLEGREPDAYAVLDSYASSHVAAVDATALDASYRLAFRSRTEFVETVLYPAAAQVDGLQAWAVSFNAGWDLSRLMAPHLPASTWEARGGFELDPTTGRRRARAVASRFAGGFSLPVWEYLGADGEWQENSLYRPRLGIKHLGTRKNLAGFIRAHGESAADKRFSGHFLDLLTLSAALTGESQSLESACTAFGFEYQEELDRLGVDTTKATVRHEVVTPDYVGYNRADTAATARLCGALLTECAALGLQTQPTRIYSTASVAKDTLDRLGIRPLCDRQPDFDARVMGFAMVSLYGGRTESHIRRTRVPVSYLDFTSLYPSVSILLGLQDFLTCRRVDVVEEDPPELERWLASLDLAGVLRPETWGAMRGLALVEPHGDILPVRADWHANGTLGIGVNRVAAAAEPLWYAIPDLVASALLAGRTPRIVRALRFEPKGRTRGLSRIAFGEAGAIDVRQENLYRALIEERARARGNVALPEAERHRVEQFFKIVANSLYGVTAEMNRRVTTRPETLEVHGLRTFPVTMDDPEEPGDFFFAPQASLTTAGGRLMLAILERLVTDRGGTWAFADTDSFAIVSSEHGGQVPCATRDGRGSVTALPYAEVEAIRTEIGRLNPYNPAVVPNFLKLEKVNFEGGDPTLPRRDLWAYSVAAKKYVLFVPGNLEVLATGRGETAAHADEEIVDRREHGLGFLRNPEDPQGDPDADRRDKRRGRAWVTQSWAYVLARDAGEDPPEPSWFGLPQMSHNATVSTPKLLRAYRGRNAGKSTAEAIKPFNFLNRVFVARDELSSANRSLALAAPYNTEPRTWLMDEYFDLSGASQAVYRITTDRVDPDVGDDGAGRVIVETYGDLVRQLPLHPESKSNGPDGGVCRRSTRGLLGRRTVSLGVAAHVAKESTQLASDGIEGTWTETRVLRDARDDAWVRDLLPALRARSTAEAARALGVAPSTVKRWRAGAQQARIAAWLRDSP